MPLNDSKESQSRTTQLLYLPSLLMADGRNQPCNLENHCGRFPRGMAAL